MKADAGTGGQRSDTPPAGPAIPSLPGRTASGVAVLAALIGVVVIGCAAIGLDAVQSSDSRRSAAQHSALTVALDELRPALGDRHHFEASELRAIERRAGLVDFRFDAELAGEGDRDVQPQLDGDGRIVGWFSWASDRSLIRAMQRLWAVIGAIGIALVLAAIVSWRATQRLGAALSRSATTIAALTTQDPATGLPNRRALSAALDAALDRRGAARLAFAAIAVDNVFEIHDSLGEAGCAAMFAAIAERLKTALPPGALLGRFGDDGFAATLAGAEAGVGSELGDKLSAALAAPIVFDHPWQITAAIGIAQAPDHGTTGNELQRRALLALRAAKRSGRGAVRRYHPQHHEEHAERRFFERELETAIRNAALEVHYQPVVAAEGGRLTGVEALLRWNHPSRGAVAPSLFIPLAEECGLMNRLGEFVLRRALDDARRWPELFVSVNLSPVQIRSRGLVDLVSTAVDGANIRPARLVLEVTEGVLIDDPEDTLQTLQALRDLGVSTALDDFGSGYSSLSYLQRFPFDRLKIDRAFVASLGVSGNAGAIVHAIVTLGHALGMKVLAEGIETNEQRVLLRLAGCDELQGYLFAKPAPADAIDKMLARPKGARAARQAGIAAS